MSDGAYLIRRFGATVASLQRKVQDLGSASQGANRSVEGGAIDVYTDDDELVARVGEQTDGSVGVRIFGGPEPAAPTAPDVTFIPGGALVAWDGRFEEYQPQLAVDRVAVHVDETPGFAVTRDTEVAAIYGGYGGTAVVPIDDGATWYVKLVAVSQSGVMSDPSTEVTITDTDSAQLGFYQDDFVLTAAGAQVLQLTFEPVDNSEHVYWNGLYQREDVDWTRAGSFVTLNAAPVAPRAGDKVVVEYAFLQPDPDTLLPYPEEVLARGPDWYFRFEPGALTVDSSGNGHPLANDFGGFTTVPGIVYPEDGGALHFDGVSQRKSTDGPFVPGTVMALIHPETGMTEDGYVVCAMSSIGASHTWYLAITPAGLPVFWFNGIGTLTGPTDLRGGDHWIMATYDRAGDHTAKLWVDGALVAQETWSGSYVDGGVNGIGAKIPFASNFFKGVIDEAAFWSGKALDGNDAIDIYAAWKAGNR